MTAASSNALCQPLNMKSRKATGLPSLRCYDRAFCNKRGKTNQSSCPDKEDCATKKEHLGWHKAAASRMRCCLSAPCRSPTGRMLSKVGRISDACHLRCPGEEYVLQGTRDDPSSCRCKRGGWMDIPASNLQFTRSEAGPLLQKDESLQKPHCQQNSC